MPWRALKTRRQTLYSTRSGTRSQWSLSRVVAFGGDLLRRSIYFSEFSQPGRPNTAPYHRHSGGLHRISCCVAVVYGTIRRSPECSPSANQCKQQWPTTRTAAHLKMSDADVKDDPYRRSISGYFSSSLLEQIRAPTDVLADVCGLWTYSDPQ